MKKIIRLTGICYLFIIIILGQISLLTVYAAEQSKDPVCEQLSADGISVSEI